MRRSDRDLRAIRDSVAMAGRLSDSLVRFGPFSLGVDGVLSWIPGVGEIYSVLAGAFILVQGLRAGAPAAILLSACALLLLRTGISATPLAGAAMADLFTAHKWAASLIVAAIDRELGEVRPGAAATDGPAPYSRWPLRA